MTAAIHPAWFRFEPGESPTLRDVSESLHELHRRLAAMGMLMFVAGESEAGLITGCEIKTIGDQLIDLGAEVGALQDRLLEEAAALEAGYTVVLTAGGDHVVDVVKAVRTITGLGLKEAKDLVQSLPANVKAGVAKAEAEDIQRQLQELGAEVHIQGTQT